MMSKTNVFISSFPYLLSSGQPWQPLVGLIMTCWDMMGPYSWEGIQTSVRRVLVD